MLSEKPRMGVGAGTTGVGAGGKSYSKSFYGGRVAFQFQGILVWVIEKCSIRSCCKMMAACRGLHTCGAFTMRVYK